MTWRSASALLVISALALATMAPPVRAHWTAGGTGSGSGTVVTMPTGGQPAAVVSGQSVTVSWTQSNLLGSLLGTYAAGGGYTLKRYASGGTTPITPNANCATTISGAGATVQCVEASVPYGAWQYSVTPVLDSFVGTESTKSTAVEVVTTAPVLSTVSAQNPAAGQSTGSIQVTWSSVTGATGYNVFRRVSGGSFNFTSPLNGGTPVAALTYPDPGSGLSASTTYDYVVRAVAGSPVVASASSNSLSATTITRPAAPPSVTAVAGVAARIDVSWPSVAGVVGYNIYRRVAPNYTVGSPLNGSTPQATLTYADLALTNGTSYKYTVRTVILGASSAQVESVDTDSAVVAADSTAPSAPTAVSVTTGPTKGATSCSITAGTRFINSAGAAAVGVSATIPTPESGESVVFSATSGATVTSTILAAGNTTVTATLNLSTLTDGAVTVQARTMDAAGNMSGTPSTPSVLKDTAAVLTGVSYHDGVIILGGNQVEGTTECGAIVIVAQTVPGSITYPQSALNGTFAFSQQVAGLVLSSYSYTVTTTDLAGNTNSAVVSGFDTA
jgi:hypothetical protein